MKDDISKRAQPRTSNKKRSSSPNSDEQLVENKNASRRRGRPKLDESERRKKLHLIYLTDGELQLLRRQHAGASEQFGSFLRSKLLATKTLVVPREIDPDVRNEIRNLLKLTGSINLIALRTKGDIVVTEEFKKTSTLIRSIASAAKKSVDHSVQLMEIAPTMLERLADLLHAVDKVENGITDFELFRTGIRELIQSLDPLIRKFEQ